MKSEDRLQLIAIFLAAYIVQHGKLRVSKTEYEAAANGDGGRIILDLEGEEITLGIESRAPTH